MSEHKLKTHIGSEIEVVVYFDYQPEEKQEEFYPGCPECADINAVYVNGDGSKTIEEVLSDDCLASLAMECLEYIHQSDEDRG